MGGEVIDVYIYIDKERERESAVERIEQSKVGSRKKVFVKDSFSKRTKNVVFILYLFRFLDYQINYYEV